MSDTPAAPRPTSVPPLIVTQDNEFWFAGAREGRLLIQRCGDCGTLRHPPGPVCPHCRSFEWDTVESARRGTLHSWTVVHKPQDPGFRYPLVVGLVDLAEGTRLVADFDDLGEGGADRLRIDMPVEVFFGEHPHGETLPRLRLAAEEAGA
ncbi:Zn-ribbon domain-containing OB-fold protein [Nocardioides sp.]|uniref:Zn-ribbon domain-containing OB-fold protein n=1 Tax=Nocardioides sp. TaxID=35761 RepID=UPI0025DE4AF8|nr:Zn-ribbon domain-containing OB-fold protein [Nocardioides sp.]